MIRALTMAALTFLVACGDKEEDSGADTADVALADTAEAEPAE